MSCHRQRMIKNSKILETERVKSSKILENEQLKFKTLFTNF